MQPIQEPITGKEEQGDLSMPYQSLVQFYCAFNSGDMKIMSENWWQSDDISTDNPLGGINRGWEDIHPVYGRIFNDLKHTYGRRLRSECIDLETRKDLLGHHNRDITTHYSGA
ncbi:MAG: hypothetical protein ACYDHG_08125 [Desulfomonilaceae bacterium]